MELFTFGYSHTEICHAPFAVLLQPYSVERERESHWWPGPHPNGPVCPHSERLEASFSGSTQLAMAENALTLATHHQPHSITGTSSLQTCV